MKGKTLLAGAVILCSMFCGCSTTRQYTYGKDFDETKRSKIVKRQSTKEGVLKLFGKPNDKDLDDNGRETWTYFYKQEENKINVWNYDAEGDVRLKKLLIVFDEDTVLNYIYSDTTNPTTYK